jgi:hypothetical protein
MYQVDDGDKVIPCPDAPEPGVPAEIVVVAGNRVLMLSYDSGPSGMNRVLVAFEHAGAHYLGSPNDETLGGHPLRTRGLGYYGVFEVQNSSWIRSLERMNRVHPRHDPGRYQTLRHFIVTFQDKTFECVAEKMSVVTQIANTQANTQNLLLAMIQRVTPS